jgi:hypothetical protein
MLLHVVLTIVIRRNTPEDAILNCKLVHNRIQDTVAPFPATATIGLYGYEANNGIRGYVASGGLVS